jgi:hypothetical protein
MDSNFSTFSTFHSAKLVEKADAYENIPSIFVHDDVFHNEMSPSKAIEPANKPAFGELYSAVLVYGHHTSLKQLKLVTALTSQSEIVPYVACDIGQSYVASQPAVEPWLHDLQSKAEDVKRDSTLHCDTATYITWFVIAKLVGHPGTETGHMVGSPSVARTRPLQWNEVTRFGGLNKAFNPPQSLAKPGKPNK